MSAEEAAAAEAPAAAEEAAAAEAPAAEEKKEEEAGGLDDDEEDELILVAQGGTARYTIPRKYCLLSNFVETILAGDTDAKEIEVKQVAKETLEFVVKYLNIHKGVVPADLPCPLRTTEMAKAVSVPADAEFIDAFDKKTIFEIILAANYMDIKPLLHLGCAKIATMIKLLDQKEINRIIEEEEKWQKEHGAAAGIVPASELKLDEEEEEEEAAAAAAAAEAAAAGGDAAVADAPAADA